MQVMFQLKHGDIEKLRLDLGESETLLITNISQDEVKVYLGNENEIGYTETFISAYSALKKSKTGFSRSQLQIKVEGIDNRKYIIRVEY